MQLLAEKPKEQAAAAPAPPPAPAPSPVAQVDPNTAWKLEKMELQVPETRLLKASVLQSGLLLGLLQHTFCYIHLQSALEPRSDQERIVCTELIRHPMLQGLHIPQSVIKL